MTYKTEGIFFRLNPELLEDVNKLMGIMKYDNMSKFIRKMLKTMVKHGKEKGII